MTAAERAQVLVTARLLEGAAKMDVLSTGLTLVAAAAIFFAMPHRIAGTAALLLGIAAKVYGVRIAFDARLFADLAAEILTGSDLDAAFPAKAGRSWSARCAGAKRLVIVQAMLVVAQCVAIAAA